MDIVGSLPIGVTQKKILLIAINYFSKWVEVEVYQGQGCDKIHLEKYCVGLEFLMLLLQIMGRNSTTVFLGHFVWK